MMDLVSVIIPSYGGGQYLSRSIDSVLNQTYPNVEAIIVDDNGLGTLNQKKTAAVLKKYENNPRVKYICHSENKNGSAARNTGVKHSSAKYIALLDDDDEYLPHKIEKQIRDIESLDDSYALVYCGINIYFNGGFRESHKTYSGSVFYEVMLHKAVIGSTSMLIRRKVWDELGGFDESFKRHQDWEFSARVAYKYNVYAEDFIGFNRYILKRNSPQNPDTILAYRKHYLEKMQPYMSMLSTRQQKEIVIVNIVDVSFQYLKHGKIVKFIKVFFSSNPGMLGLKIILRRLLLIIRRGKLVIS